ncbi:MAG TPA: phosphotyrosine protein phosphatase [Sphingobium sp.]|uniref:arsenate reductase/protein-tyrosine-phosphatase family protein n=1 Tax=unclassified Sphingobium TaxID=2611147 RepID=UPI0007F36C13|nr:MULTISPECIES: phosphotyrosine protein phosphatase [unclassified Sphingobium]OAN50976.1 phosphotyrosine protein phosphatase [Sphingobium sp. TCM1]HAF40286.1 phosphotyrosine protein phosphatase [Sphingobium sp.]
MIRRHFGTLRGLARLALSYPQLLLGLSASRRPDPRRVTRLVFVCQGNICRSAFADVAARRAGLRAASFGLSTTTGRAAHPPAIAAAQDLGHDLSDHRAIDLSDYVPEPGDLLLAMEVRQLHRLAADPRLRDLPRQLLGRWTWPMLPHLHDPYGLDDRYMARCLRRIGVAVERLAISFPGARLS